MIVVGFVHRNFVNNVMSSLITVVIFFFCLRVSTLVGFGRVSKGRNHKRENKSRVNSSYVIEDL